MQHLARRPRPEWLCAGERNILRLYPNKQCPELEYRTLSGDHGRRGVNVRRLEGKVDKSKRRGDATGLERNLWVEDDRLNYGEIRGRRSEVVDRGQRCDGRSKGNKNGRGS